MLRSAFNAATWISAFIVLASVVLFLASFWFTAWDYHLTLRSDFHIGLWDGRVVFFSDGEDGPYRGSILRLDMQPSPAVYYNATGIYYRHFTYPDKNLWTLMVNLLWPMALFAPLGMVRAVALIVAVYRRYGRQLADCQLCTGCGYDCRASKGHCPECGAPLPDFATDAKEPI